MNYFLKQIISFLVIACFFVSIFLMDTPADSAPMQSSGGEASGRRAEVLLSDLEDFASEDLAELLGRFDALRGNPQQIKGVMLLMVLQEHILEVFLAEKIAAKEGKDTCDFDKRFSCLLGFERAVFNQLHPETQDLWTSFEEHFAQNGSKFNFRSIRSWFEMRASFAPVCLTYLRNVTCAFSDESWVRRVFLFLGRNGDALFERLLKRYSVLRKSSRQEVRRIE